MSDTTLLSHELQEVSHSLGQSLFSSEPFTRERRARQALETDPAAKTLLAELEKAQEQLYHAEETGSVTPGLLKSLGRNMLFDRVRSNHVIQEYDASHQAIKPYLREVNNEISELLGLNFALIARRSSCC